MPIYQKLFTNQKGSIYFLIPLSMALFFILLTSSHLLITVKEQQKQSYLCQKNGIELQSIYAQLANSLEELNPSARLLHKQSIQAKKMIQIAPTLPAKAAAIAYHKMILWKQSALRFKQKTLLIKFQAKAHIFIQRNFLLKNYISKKIPLKLHFQRKPPHSLSPEYVPSLGFKEKQAFQLQWKKRVPLNKNSFLIGKCEVQLNKEKTWLTKIKMDKL